MGLYLCVFDRSEELEGVEIGSYDDFGVFRDAVIDLVEDGELGTVCPVLVLHHDCDGEWTPAEAARLIEELNLVQAVFRRHPAIALEAWQHDIASERALPLETLDDCFFDIDGERLIDRLRELANVSVASGQPVLFQ